MFQSIKKIQGFSLVELVIVIVIIGILAGVAVVKFTDLSGTAQDAACEANTARVNSAVGIMLAQKGGTPPTVRELAQSGFRVAPTISGGSLNFGNNCIVETYANSDCSGSRNNGQNRPVLCAKEP